MQTLYEDDLVEAAVTLCTAGRFAGATPEQNRAFHAERERCYLLLDADRRTEAFARLHLDWFSRWGLQRRLEGALEHFPELNAVLEVLVFRQARGRHDEGAELYRDGQDRRRGVLALRPDRLVSEPVLTGFLHHELAHLADMVSPEFQYGTAAAGGRTASQERLVRERYRLLWSIRIDGGLARRGLAGVSGRERRRAEFEKAFGFLSEARRTEVFEGLWTGSLTTHADLLHLAVDPRELEGHREPIPGAPCALCGFAAFVWADGHALGRRARERIQSEFPDWRPNAPVCARCAEIYEAVTGIEYPSTVCL